MLGAQIRGLRGEGHQQGRECVHTTCWSRERDSGGLTTFSHQKKKRKHYSLQSQSWLKQCESKQPTQDRARVALLPPNLTRWKIFPGSAKQQRQQIDFSGFSFFVMQLPQKPSQNGGLDPVRCAWPAAGRDATAHTPFGLGGTCQNNAECSNRLSEEQHTSTFTIPVAFRLHFLSL